ncbi:peptidylprolyl isomerase [Streptomyces sp. A7024]|uniref:Peptidylprolyl isomerase n=1 Tax=Streptomyces coryli TaxID=1128680 RepID=A0A6G4TT82_9ACTN|nr:peptidylprolyl isomerase [Streptomyces coryli]
MASKDARRRQIAREKYERQQQRRQEARGKARKRNAIIAAVLAVVLASSGMAWVAGAFDGDSGKKNDAADEPSTPPTSKAPDPCDKPAAGKPATKTWKKEPKVAIDKSASYSMKLQTTCGDIGIDLDAENAPRTVNSFDFLAGQKYFDHTKCHRMTNQGIFVVQCGDPKGTGQGGPGYTIPDENLKSKDLKGGKYPAGTVAMANMYNPQTKQGKNSGGSQFFLVYKDSQLPPYYTPFGKVDKAGMKVLEKIAKAGVAPMDPQTQNTAPNATVVINKATVSKN